MANNKINGGASPYPKHVGPAPICSFSDGADGAPLKSLIFSIEPNQSGSGDPSPQNIRPITGWTQCDAVAAGVNLLDSSDCINDVFLAVANNVATVTSIAGASVYYAKVKPNTTYTLSHDNGDRNVICGYSSVPTIGATSTSVLYNSGIAVSPRTFTTGPNDTYVAIYVNRYPTSKPTKIQLEVGSTDHTYAAPTITPITIALGQTVYGGYVDALRGKCYARPYYSSYSGQTLVGPWISSHDKYVSGATPTTGAQVVDMGGAVTEISVTAQQVSSLLGQNNIWCNTGDTELDYYPAQSSVVAVWDRTRHMYVSIPLSDIRYDTHQTTPNQALDLDSYRSETGVLIRNVLSHTVTKIELNTPSMTNLQWEELWDIIKAGFNNMAERKLKLKYYDQMNATYKTGWFYVPDVQFKIRNIDEANGIINYNEIRIAFIEY